MNIATTRLQSQQLIKQQFASPEDVVSHFGAMQAQEYRQVRWGVAMRMKKPNMESFRRAFDDGRIIRIHLHRGTWQLIAGKDYGWLFPLLAERTEQVIRGWMHASKIEITESEEMAIREHLVACTEKLGSACKEDYERHLAEMGIVMDDHRLSYHIRLGEMHGILCSGRLSTSKSTYSLVGQKLTNTTKLTRDEALARITEAYFRSHSPATIEDFQWWSGLTLGECRRGITILGKRLMVFEQNGMQLILHENCEPCLRTTSKSLLLPAYDEYLIGYKSRHFGVSPTWAHKAYSNNGIFQPVIVHKGHVCGNWKPFGKEMDAQYFDSPTPQEEITDRLWKAYQKYRDK